jgi:hypothetical protein
MPGKTTYDLLHARNIDQYARQVRASYLKAIKQVSLIAKNARLDAQDSFYFKNNKNIQLKVNNVLKELQNNVYGTTVTGINSEWELAVEKNNAVAQKIYGKNLDQLPEDYKAKYLSNNDEARLDFVSRKMNGLGLSDRVWNNTQQFKQELELALETSIGKGKSARSIASEITQYLNNPDKLFRRIKDKETGVMRLSKAAKAFHPGQGKYRSSYKNALRLARNETNFSYEGSNHLKQQQQDFVVGIEIRTSPQHVASDDKGGISCIDLQGKYPKDFDFTYKWHVNCKCMSLTILKTKEELDKDLDSILAGNEPNKSSINKVKVLPKKYTTYLKDNKEKFDNWKTMPRTFENNPINK